MFTEIIGVGGNMMPKTYKYIFIGRVEVERRQNIREGRGVPTKNKCLESYEKEK